MEFFISIRNFISTLFTREILVKRGKMFSKFGEEKLLYFYILLLLLLYYFSVCLQEI